MYAKILEADCNYVHLITTVGETLKRHVKQIMRFFSLKFYVYNIISIILISIIL